jgi:tetratricopeptide (TPR) repeat protein
VVESLRLQLAETLSGTGTAQSSRRTLTDEEIERLGSLGYVHASSARADSVLPDPKSMMEVYNDALRSESLYGRGMYAEAATLARSVLERSDMLLQAVRVLAFSNVKLDRADEAVSLLLRSTERNPDVFLVRSLAQVLILEGRYAEAMEILDLYASIKPGDGRVPLLRGDILARQGRTALAISEYEKAIGLDEHRTGIQARQRIERLGR